MWQQADHILLPLLNGKSAVLQVVEIIDAASALSLCAISNRVRTATDVTTPISLSEVIAVLKLAPPEDAQWPVAGFEQIPRIRDIWPLRDHALNNFADVPERDPAVVEAFVNACHGLYPWDGFPDPQFFTGLLLSPDTRTPARVFKDATA